MTEKSHGRTGRRFIADFRAGADIVGMSAGTWLLLRVQHKGFGRNIDIGK